ncbi:LysM peptidoglycan-binding domain-containing protein [Prosthecobacter sp. SYSU 5D2]|uniref:LysM peptidoglycan-binding domain-containing protein n=1 Tax=Prosthecobacter sp. SYSU 5D2 TaxID=3134134 RepID=UPI0031FF27C3
MAAKNTLFHATAVRRLLIQSTVLLLGSALSLSAQTPAQATVEPGMEMAVQWRWTPEPSDAAAWGLSLDAPPAPEPGSPAAAGGSANARPQGPPETTLEYQVVKGDSLYVIARRYGVTVDQLKAFNGMKRDLINIGQTLRIPSLADIQAMAPPPPPPPKVEPGQPVKAVPVPEDEPEVKPLLKRPLPSAASSVARVVLMQAYLDRQGFSAGPIDGTDGPLYDAALRSYETANPGVLTFEMGQVPAVLTQMGGAFIDYQLKREDFRWIAPEPEAPPSRSRTPAPAAPAVTLESLTAGTFLPYRNVWEFVAERFHCSESFLRRINSGLKSPVSAGALFFVPNVIPFEIETALDEPLQPAADPAKPVTATIVSNNRMEIRRSGKLIANLPIAVARPGLRGRGTWKILEAIPRPQMTTLGDPAAPFSSPLVLPAGPNNPVGPIWIHLAKANDPAPLPYGLHGTSIPGYMRRQESIGGFRMTNWNIAYAVRLLPAGTPLTWQ